MNWLQQLIDRMVKNTPGVGGSDTPIDTYYHIAKITIHWFPYWLKESQVLG